MRALGDGAVRGGWLGYSRLVTDRHGTQVVGLDRGLVRAARAVLVSLASVWLAIACHTFAGGMPPPEAVQVGLLVVVGVAAFALGGRRWTLPRLTAALLVVQAATHVLSAAASPMAHMAGGSDLRMIGLHVVGTAVSVVLLRHGEDALWSLVERTGLRRALTLVEATATPYVVRRHPRSHHAVAALHGAALAARLEIRGPPA